MSNIGMYAKAMGITVEEAKARVERQKEIQPGIPPAPRRTVKDHELAMVRKHGADPEGRVCGDCSHLKHFKYHGKHYYKCELYGISHSEATDWRKKWKACRLFEAGES